MDKYNGKSNNNQQMPSFLQAIGAIMPHKQTSGPSMRSGTGQTVSSSSFLQSISRTVVSTSSITSSLGHQLISDSNFQGGKTVHHMGQSGASRTKNKEPSVVKIEVGLNPTSQKKQGRSSSSGDGPTRCGPETTSREPVFPPVKKIKLEIGDAGVWETKKEQEEYPSCSSVPLIVNETTSNNDDDYYDEDDDVCPVDYKSRCVILIEEEMQNIVKNFKNFAKELYYLENGGDILDYPVWLKKINPSLDEYLDDLARSHEMSIKGIESEEAKVFTSGSGTLPTITPVAISKKLPAAITALQQKQHNEPSGGIPLSTTAATTTIGSPTPLNSSCNENSSSSSKTATLATLVTGAGTPNQGLVRPIPIVVVPSSAAGLLLESSMAPLQVPPYINSLDPLSVVTVTSIMTTPSIISLSTRSSTPPGPIQLPLTSQEVTVEQAKQEAKVLSRVAELRRQGLWSLSRLPKVVEPERPNAHWDMLLKEMEWMAVDFAMERRWKIKSSSVIAHSIIRSEAIAERKRKKRKEEKRKIEMASGVARIVEEFWVTAQEEYLINNYNDMDKEIQKLLETIIVSTTKGILGMDKSLVSNIDPNFSHLTPEYCDNDDHKQEIKELLSSAEWPIDDVLKKFYPKMLTNELKADHEDEYQEGDINNHCAEDRIQRSELESPYFDQNINLEIFEYDELHYNASLGELEPVEEMRTYKSIEELACQISQINEEMITNPPKNDLFTGPVTLRPYQVVSAFRLSKFQQQGIPYLEIRDHGLGTKLQMAYHLSCLASLHQEWGCHLVVIKDLCDIYSWRSTFAKFTPSLKVKVILDEIEEGESVAHALQDASENCNLLITCYNNMTHHMNLYKAHWWKTVIIDKIIDLSDSHPHGLLRLECKHLILLMDSKSIPSDILSFANSICEDTKNMVTNVVSEPLKELVALVLRGKIVDASVQNDPIFSSGFGSKSPLTPLTMDEAVRVFKWLTACTLRKDVIGQLQTTNILTLASSLPTKQSLAYNEKFGLLIEESPDVQSLEFILQVNELYNTCAHLENHMQESIRISSKPLYLADPVISNSCTVLPFLCCEKNKDKQDILNSLKHLLNFYCWGTGLLEHSQVESLSLGALPNSLSEESEPMYLLSLNFLKLILGCKHRQLGLSYHEKIDNFKSVLEAVNRDCISAMIPADVMRSFWNLIWLLKPLRSPDSSLGSLCNNSSFGSLGIKKEVIDYSYEDNSESMEGIEEGIETEEIFDVLGSDCMKELTSIGKRVFEEELNRFLINCTAVIAQVLESVLCRKASSDLFHAKKLITPIIECLIDGPLENKMNHVDRKIVGCHKGKLSSLSMLMDKERQAMFRGRFILLTRHLVTAQSLQWFLNSRALAYVLINHQADVNEVRRSVSKFNQNQKYSCILIHYQNKSLWEPFIHVLGMDALPFAKNLVVLDEELTDVELTSADQCISREPVLFWQLLARKMSAFQDLNIIRLYYKNTVEGYQVHRRWSENCLDELFQKGTSKLGAVHKLQCDIDCCINGNEFQPLNIKSIKNCVDEGDGGNEEDDLEFIYSSHQECLKRLNKDSSCSCSLGLDGYGGNEVEREAFDDKQKEIQSYALAVINRQLRTSEMSLRKQEKSGVKFSKFSEETDVFECDLNSYEPLPYDDLLTYKVDFTEPECFISDLTGEKMPVWAPPTPPQDDDVFVDRNVLLLYESTPMSETQLPSPYVRKGNKRIKIDDSVRSSKSIGREGKHDLSSIHRPKSLFERPPVPSPPNTITLSTATSLAYGFHIDRDGRLINKAGIPVGQPYARSPTVPVPISRPSPETQTDLVDWQVYEDWVLLQAYQMACIESSLHALDLYSSNLPPPQSRLPNWELISFIVNGFSRVFRSARQCRLRYENVIVPREEGRSHMDNGQRKIKKTSKGLYKTKTNRQLKTIQIYHQDNHRSLSTHLSHLLDLFKNFIGRKSTIKAAISSSTQSSKTNHAAFMSEHNIDYDRPLSPSIIADMRLERANKEKEKRVVPERVQQTPPVSTTAASVALAVQQVQHSSADSSSSSSSSATAPGTPISTSLTVPIGAALSVVLPNSQLRMAVPGAVGSQQQQQQQVIIQAAVAQQQMAIVASAASNSLLGKVPLVSGVTNTIPAVRNLANLSFVVNQSAAGNQQNTTFVTVSKAQGPVVTTVGIVTSLSPSTIKAIRNINPAAASQLAGSINIVQNKATPSATAVAFPPGMIQNNRIAIRSPGALLNQRLTQKPATSQQQQQVTLTPGTNLANLQKLNQVGVVSVPTTQMSQTFHVKNHQVLLKQKQQTSGSQQQQLTGATVVGRLAAASSGQGTALQFQHLQLPAKTPLLEVMQQQTSSTQQQQQQQQILATNFTSTQVNVTALIKTASANSNLGKVVAPAQTPIRQPQVAKRPTVTAINIPSQGNRTTLVMGKGASSNQVIYQQQKVVLQPPGVKQQPGVQLQQGAILAMTPRGVNISAIGLAPGNGMAIPINPTSLAQGMMASGQSVRVAKQMINSPKVAPVLQHITVRAPQQQQTSLSSAPIVSVSSPATTSIVRPQQNPTSSA